MRTEKCRQPLRVHIYRYSCACTAMHKHGRQTNNCKKNIAKIVQLSSYKYFIGKGIQKKRSLTKILVFCLVFSGAGSLFRDFSFLLQRFFTSIKKGKIRLGAWYYSSVWIQNLWLNCHTCAVVGIAIACIAIISSF